MRKSNPSPARRASLLLAAIIAFCLVLPSATAAPRTLVFFGDSLTAGYGLGDPANEAYPALIRDKIAASGLDWRVVNAGLSGETSSGGLRRIDWILRSPVDIFVLALGANDGLRGINPTLTRQNLQQIIERVRAKSPGARVILAGMQLPPEMGPDYTQAFAAIFPSLAREQDATLIPFLLAGVGGDTRLNQADRVHPNSSGHALMAETVWLTLKPLL